MALFKKGAWKQGLGEGRVNLGGRCQCMDRLWVKLTAPPRKNWLLYSSRNWGGQRSPGGQRKLLQPAKHAGAGSRGAPGHYLLLSFTLLPSAPFGCER